MCTPCHDIRIYSRLHFLEIKNNLYAFLLGVSVCHEKLAKERHIGPWAGCVEPPRAHFQDLLDKLQRMSVKQRFSFSHMVLLWKITQGFSQKAHETVHFCQKSTPPPKSRPGYRPGFKICKTCKAMQCLLANGSDRRRRRLNLLLHLLLLSL